MYKVVGKIVMVMGFVEGDVICSTKNNADGHPIWFTATDYDVKHYSNKGGLYYKLVFDKTVNEY